MRNRVCQELFYAATAYIAALVSYRSKWLLTNSPFPALGKSTTLEYTPFLAYTVMFRSFARVFQMYRPPIDCEEPAIRVIPRVFSTNRYNLLASFLPLYRESTSTRSTCQAPFLLLKPRYATFL